MTEFVEELFGAGEGTWVEFKNDKSSVSFMPLSEPFKEFMNKRIEPGLMSDRVFAAWFFIGALTHFPISGVQNAGVQKVCIKHSTEALTGGVLKYAYVETKPSGVTELALRHIVLGDMKDAVSRMTEFGRPAPRYKSFTPKEIEELLHTFQLDRVPREMLTTTFRSLQLHGQDVKWCRVESEEEEYKNDVEIEQEILVHKIKQAARMRLIEPQQQQQDETIIRTFLTIEDSRNDNTMTRDFSQLLASTDNNNVLNMEHTVNDLLRRVGWVFEENQWYFSNVEQRVSRTNPAHLAFTAGSLILNFKNRFHLDVSIERFLYDRRIQLNLLNTKPGDNFLSANVPVIIEGMAENEPSISTRWSSMMKKSGIQEMLSSFSGTNSKRAVFAVINFDDTNPLYRVHIQSVEINHGLFHKFISTRGFEDSLSTTEQINEFVAKEARFLEANLHYVNQMSEIQSFLLGQISAVPVREDDGKVQRKYTFEHEDKQLNQDFVTMLVEHGSDLYAINFNKRSLERESVGYNFFEQEHITFLSKNNEKFFYDTVTRLKCLRDEYGIRAVVEKCDFRKFTPFQGLSIPIDNINVPLITQEMESSTTAAFSQVSNVVFNNKHFFPDQSHLKSFFKGLFFADNIIVQLFNQYPNGLLGIVQPENEVSLRPTSRSTEISGLKLTDPLYKWGGVILINMDVISNVEAVPATMKSLQSHLLVKRQVYGLDSPDIPTHLCVIVGNRMAQGRDQILTPFAFEPPYDENLARTFFETGMSSCYGRSKRSFSQVNCEHRKSEFEDVIEKSLDKNRFVVNSEKLLNFLKRESPQKSAALLDEITLLPESMITMNGQEENRIKSRTFIDNVRLKAVLEKAAISSNVANQIMVYKDVVGDIMRGDWKGFASLVSLLYISKKLDAAAGKMRQAGLMLKNLRIFKSTSIVLRSTAPFVGRLTLAFIIYDLVKNVNQMKTYGFDIDSAVSAAADATFVLIDVTVMTLELLEDFSLIERVASSAGVVGMVIGAIVFIGANAFSTYRQVSQIDHLIHLSLSEKAVEGLRAFLGLPPRDYLANLLEKKQKYNQMLEQAENFLIENKQFKNYIFPLQRKLENGTWIDIDDNVIYMREKNSSIRFDRDYPDSNKASKLVCFNSVLPPLMSNIIDLFLDESALPGQVRTNSTDGFFICSNSMGVSIDESHTDLSLVVLKDGNDVLLAPFYTPSYVLVGNGKKFVTGGYKDDVFFFMGTHVFGNIDGISGDDTADFTNFAPEATRLEIDAINETVHAPGTTLFTHSISQWVGRVGLPDTVTCSCKTKIVNSKGGGNLGPSALDFIYVPNLNCYFKININVDDNTIVHNEATYGQFVYIIGGNDNATSQIYIYNNGARSQHKLMFPFHIEEVSKIEQKNEYTIFTMNNNRTVSVIYNFNNTNVYFALIDGLFIRFEPNNTVNVYGHAPTNVNQMRQSYIKLSERLNTTFTVFSTVSNVTLLVSHSNKHLTMGYPFYTSNIIQNDPYDETVICGGHGENVYIIIHKEEKLKRADQAQLPNIEIWEDLGMNHTRILNLRNLQEKFEKDLGLRTYIDLEVTKEDVIVSVLVRNNVQKNSILICTIRFKELASQEKLIESLIIVNRQPISILKRDNKYVLKPPEVILSQNTSHVVLYADIVECGTTFKIQKNVATFQSFVHNKTLVVLACCDIYTKLTSMVIILVDFYTNFDIFGSLEIQFTNRRLIVEDMKPLEKQKQLSSDIEEADKKLNEMLSQLKTKGAAR